MRVLSGIQPTARFHWGNYFGAVRQHIALQDNEQAFYFIADLHALTTIRDAKLLRELSVDAAIDYLALGLDPQKAAVFRQSEVPEVTELAWLLMTMTPMGLLEKCHAYKDKTARGLPTDAGLFTYPVLMAADILLYESDIVPVGVDQVQHIEVARDVAQKFNYHYGDVFVLRAPHVLDATAKVPGTDGEKMSKSYGNTIEMFEPEKTLRKKVMAIKTDSTPVEAPKDPNRCNLFTLYKLFAPPEQQAALAARYRAGGMGYGEAKQALFQAAWDYFAVARAKREKRAADPATIEEILEPPARPPRPKGAQRLHRAR